MVAWWWTRSVKPPMGLVTFSRTTSGLRPKVTLKSRALFLLNSQTFQNFKQSQNYKNSPNSNHTWRQILFPVSGVNRGHSTKFSTMVCVLVYFCTVLNLVHVQYTVPGYGRTRVALFITQKRCSSWWFLRHDPARTTPRPLDWVKTSSKIIRCHAYNTTWFGGEKCIFFIYRDFSNNGCLGKHWFLIYCIVIYWYF